MTASVTPLFIVIRSVEIQKIIEDYIKNYKKEETEKETSIEKLIEDRLRKFEDKLDMVMTNKFSNICQSLEEKMKETIVTKTIVDIPEKMNESFKEL